MIQANHFPSSPFPWFPIEHCVINVEDFVLEKGKRLRVLTSLMVGIIGESRKVEECSNIKPIPGLILDLIVTYVDSSKK